MNEDEIRKSIAEVKQGTLSRRSFIQKMAAAGIAAPIASQILALERRRDGECHARHTSRPRPAAAGR